MLPSIEQVTISFLTFLTTKLNANDYQILLEFLPSFMVFTTTGELFGPSPIEVKANARNSYSVYLSSPMTVLS